MKKIVLLALGMAMSMTTFAQDEIETTISGDIVSSYIWRGQDLGSAAIQPTLGIAYKGLSLSAWGSYSTGAVLTQRDVTSSMTLTAPTTFLRPISVMTSDLPRCSGLPTLLATMVPTKTANAPIAATLRLVPPSNSLPLTGQLQPVQFPSPQRRIMAGHLALPLPTYH